MEVTARCIKVTSESASFVHFLKVKEIRCCWLASHLTRRHWRSSSRIPFLYIPYPPGKLQWKQSCRHILRFLLWLWVSRSVRQQKLPWGHKRENTRRLLSPAASLPSPLVLLQTFAFPPQSWSGESWTIYVHLSLAEGERETPFFVLKTSKMSSGNDTIMTLTKSIYIAHLKVVDECIFIIVIIISIIMH